MNDRHQLFVGLFILALALGLGVWQWSEMQAMKQEAVALQTEASNLTAFSKSLADDYKEIKVEVTASREASEQALTQVFPQTEDLTALTRMFDDYSVKNNFESNPFFISSLQYGVDSEESEDSSAYRSLTLNLTAESSKKNLSKFLEMIENSGSLEGETRLMSVQSLVLSYPTEYGGTYDVRAQIRAYYAPAL